MLVTLVLVGYYVLNSMTGYLYSEQKTNVTAMANMVSSFAPNYMSEDGEKVDERFGKFVKDVIGDTKMRVLVLNRDCMVIFDSQNNLNLLGKAQVKPSVLTAVGGKSGYYQFYNDDRIITMDAAAPILQSGNVTGVVNIVCVTDNITAFGDATESNIWLITLVVSILVGLLIFFVVNLIVGRIVGFTNKITSMSSDGILDEKLDIRGNDEISKLAVAFNDMSEKVLNLEHKRVEFVSNASHELKTPLSSIKLMADSIIQTPDIDIDYVREFLIDMNNEVDRLNRIVNKLLYITKMDTDSEKLEQGMDVVSLSEILAGIEKNLLPIANRDEITLHFECDDSLYVLANKDMLWQGIYNVVDNAIKYSNEFGKVEVSAKSEKGKIIIKIKDSGMGISSEEINKIFERFYRVDKARSRATGGTGLGLSIAQAAVVFHGGTISVKSELGEGSVFTIVLPSA